MQHAISNKNENSNTCILSMQRVDNFGSLLQAYALKKMIESLGHRVNFLDIEPSDDNALAAGIRYDSFADESEYATHNALGRMTSKLDRTLIRRVSHKLEWRKQCKIFEAFRNQQLGIRQESNDSRYDTCVIGSDEVFNGVQASPWGFTTQLYGNVRQAERVITYAASCGSCTLEQLPELAKQAIEGSMRNIAALSVRDANTLRFVAGLGRSDAQINLDPVVVGDFAAEIAGCSDRGIPARPYCLVYAYRNRIHDPSEISAIMQLCRDHGLVPYCIGGGQAWLDKSLVLEPFQLLRAFQRAKFVVTDTFHGTIFASRWCGNFATIVRQSNKNKLADLTRRLCIDDHVISSPQMLERAWLLPSSVEAVEAIAAQERKRSIAYLAENL